MASRRNKPPTLAGATLSEFDGVRYLHLGTPWVQGAMRLKKPDAIELEYVRRMLAWMLWRPTAALREGHAVQLGLGAAAITRFTFQQLGLATTVVEINPTVIHACQMFFRLPAHGGGLAVVEGDAAAWAADPAHAACADVLCVDLYDHDAAAPVLDDEAFYRACQALLKPGGVMSVNLFGRDASFARSSARIAAAFGADQVWQLTPTREGNTVVVAGRGLVVPGRDELQARADHIEERYQLPARKWLRMVRPWQAATMVD
jgi:spermidine synthase